MSNPIKEVELEFRGFKANDINFILNSWLQSYRANYSDVHSATYFDGQRVRISKISDYCKILLVCDKETPDFILGWICYEDRPLDYRLHYLYVKYSYRRRGLGRMLLEKAGWTLDTKGITTHLTEALKPVYKRYGFQFNPFMVDSYLIGDK